MGENIDLVFGNYELRITKVYQLIYYINDLLLALVPIGCSQRGRLKLDYVKIWL